ncbi:hypothetical protein NMG60_11030491 [Bertholletia excelsa]
MDGVELALPAAVAVSKLMGPEGFGGVEVGAAGGGGGVGVSVVEVEASESDRIAIVVAPSIDRCSSILSEKDEVGAINVLESTGLNKRDTESCGKTNQASGFHSEGAAEGIEFGSKSSFPSSMPIFEGKQIQRKKVVRNNVGNSKRSRMAQMEEISINEEKVDVIKDKAQTGKQKNGLNGKRGDKRNGKAPLKSKYDCFSLKAGMLSSAGGGNNFLGIYNWKPYPCDVTKYLDDLLVNDLLDGHYKCPSFAKDKGKKSTNSSESIVQSVRKACSILQCRPIQNQNTNGIDDNYYWKSSTCPVSSDTVVPCGNDSDKGDSCAVDLSSHEKFQDSYTKPQLGPNLLEFPLCQPKDVLRRLALPLPKDLDSFLLDVAKPTPNTKSSSDSRDKQISDRASLPPFPWSHYNGGHCKSNADSSKLCLGRTTCQGRWVKIEKTPTSLEGGTGFLMNLESLTYDQSLVPSADLIYCPSGKEMAPSTPMSFPRLELGPLSSLKCSVVSQLLPESGGVLKCEEDAERSPRLLEAAYTLCHIATHSSKQEARGLVRWLKKSSEKTMKACKSKTTVKSGEISAVPKSVIATADHVKNAHEIFPFKKPRLLVNEKNKGPGHNGIRKGPNNWSVPRSGRSSPSKAYRECVAETKCFSANIVKQPYTTPPPPRFLDKSYNGRRS